MLFCESDTFELEENETEFLEICNKLKTHSIPSPWKMFFKSVDEYNTDVEEFHVDENQIKQDANINPVTISASSIESRLLSSDEYKASDIKPLDKKKIYIVKEALMNVQENNSIDHLQDLEIFLILSSAQLPIFFEILDVPNLNETAVILLINTFLHLKDKISMATATALVHYVIYPKVLEIKNSRSLLTSVVKFSEIYPKAIIDEVVIPFLNEKSSDDLPTEILFQLAKINLPNEYVSYCIRNILECAMPSENLFTILQYLTERKIHLGNELHDLLLRKLQGWSSIFSSNIKFSKLLTSILSTYGSELTNHQILQCEEVIQNNKTIIKKAAENLLKKIKQGST